MSIAKCSTVGCIITDACGIKKNNAYKTKIAYCNIYIEDTRHAAVEGILDVEGQEEENN